MLVYHEAAFSEVDPSLSSSSLDIFGDLEKAETVFRSLDKADDTLAIASALSVANGMVWYGIQVYLCEKALMLFDAVSSDS